MASSKAEILRASRERDKKKRRLSHFFGLFVSFLIVTSFLVVVNLSFLRVTELELVGQTSADKTMINKFVKEQLSGHYLGVVPRNSIFFVYKKALINKLLEEFLGLSKITITWPNLNTLSVVVFDRESKVLWCVDVSEIKECYYLAPTGRAYQPAPNFSKSFYIELHSRVPLRNLGDKVIESKSLLRSTTLLNFVKSSMSLWPTEGLILSKAEVYSQNDFIITLLNPNDPSWQSLILFNTNQTANNLITNYHSILKNDKFKEDWQAGEGRLEYLDLRFPGKVFYRFK